MFFNGALTGLAVFVSASLPAVSSACSRLPSGKCWVNCMKDVYDIMCFNATEEILETDLRVFADTDQDFRLYVWKSPLITELSATIFNRVADQILGIDLQDVTELSTFPEVRYLSKLARLNVWNSPLLDALTLEQFSPTVRKIALNKVAIPLLENDFSEVQTLPMLETFVMRNCTTNGWRAGFFKVAPKLKSFELSNCTLILEESITNDFINVTHISDFKIITNNITLEFTNDTEKIQMRKSQFLANLLESLTVANDAHIDLTGNNVDITNDVAAAIQKLNGTGHLSIRGNKVTAGPSIIQNMFLEFRFLRFLDLGHTDMVPADGFLSGTPLLETVLMDYNGRTSIEGHLVERRGSQHSLIRLDSSGNKLTSLGSGTLQSLATRVQSLSFRDNLLISLAEDHSYFAGGVTQEERYSDDDNNVNDGYSDSYSDTKASLLQQLDLSHNNLSEFRGASLGGLRTLQTLDLSCNRFKNISKEFFRGLPANLTSIKMDLCFPQNVVWFQMDCFSTVKTVTNISLRSGKIKQWIFLILKNSTAQLSGLQELRLDDNDFSALRKDTISSLPKLTLLSLSRNKVQSMENGAFARLPNLRELYLNGNRISTINTKTFSTGNSQLQRLEILDLSSNGIYNFAPGAFDDLPALQSLMIGHNDAPLEEVFKRKHPELRYLGVQDFTYGCLRAEFFALLPSLQWMLPDKYNLLAVNPGSLDTSKTDEYLRSLIRLCEQGKVIPSSGNDYYPGLSNFVTVTIHDTDESASQQYPVILGFIPLNYCPNDSIEKVQKLVCSVPRIMKSVLYGS